MDRPTSLITILSSEHGRLRREQRDIDKRDLQKALKYGLPQRVWGRRWRIEYDGIVFITDDHMTCEVTCFPSPLAKAATDSKERMDHSNAKQVVALKPTMCASHTVLVVDVSGSMNTHDIALHRDRRTAAYCNMALEYVAEQIFNGTANNKDVVSLIEFNKTSTVVFRREPVSWVLYNMLLERRDGSTNFQGRMKEQVSDLVNCDSNYLPALALAQGLLSEGFHEECALTVFFLSDGAPTDGSQLKITPTAVQRRVCAFTKNMAETYGENLNLFTVGFGSSLADFSVLQKMADVATNANSGSKAEFIFCSNVANAIGDAVTSSVASNTETRTSLLEGKVHRYTKRTVASEKGETTTRKNWQFYKIYSHLTFDPGAKKWVVYRGLPPGAFREKQGNEFKERTLNVPPLIAIRENHCGVGAERVAFRCHLADGKAETSFVLGAMVAKETMSVERLGENQEFHRGFIETQTLAATLAHEFNRRLKAFPSFDPLQTPRLEFLECSVILVKDPNWLNGTRGLLLEKWLDTVRYPWTKWNNNAGAVDGRYVHEAFDADKELAKIARKKAARPKITDAFIEEGSDEDSDSESEGEADAFSPHGNSADGDTLTKSSFCPSDYLQAFTHFTYRFTDKKVMVCDLQGIYKGDVCPPIIELSDPAIHYSSKKGKMRFGRTDKGRKGTKLFFKSHRCTKICKLMELSGKNKDWKKSWHEGDWLAKATHSSFNTK